MYRTLYEGINALEAPEHIKRAMLARGSTNPHGEPNYRLVRTEARRHMSGGRWFEWAKGTSVKHKNPGLHRPVRSFVGMKAVPMYPGEHGWTLERWMPPETFGSPVQWYAPEAMGGTKRWLGLDDGYILSAGHFPHFGDYQGTEYIFRTSPHDSPDPELLAPLSEAVILNAIGRIERLLDGMPRDPYSRALLECALGEAEEQRQEDEFGKFAEDVLAEELEFFQVHTPGARADVNRFAEGMGIKEEVF